MRGQARERAGQEALGRLRTLARDHAVSPVVGMILVLGISIVGTASILYWGLPAIDEMKANVEFRSVEGQFTELDSTLKELVAGTTEKTAKRWQPTLSRGEIDVKNGTQGWLFATEPYNASVDHDLGWSGFADGDSAFTVHNLAAFRLEWVKVECYKVQGTSSLTALNVSVSASSDDQMVSSDLKEWNAGTARAFYLYEKDAGTHTAVPIKDATFKCRVFTGASVVGEAWYANTGSIDYTLSAGLGVKSLIENNGALLSGDGESYAITNSPSIAPPSTAGGVYRTFSRSVVLFGEVSFAGEDSFDMLVTLYSTAVLGSYDCALASRADCAESAKIFIYGDLRDTWHDYLTNEAKGYRYDEKTLSGTDVVYLEDRQPFMGYTLLQSTVRMSG